MPVPIRILHIDDNPLDAELVTMALEIEKARLQMDVRYVQSKEEYLAALERKDFDLILSDYRMGTYDGEQALAAAKEKCPDIPFIMVTGELGEEMVIETLKRGATDYVLKDRIFRLVPAIERALAEREIRRKQKQAEEEAQKAHREANEVLESVQDPFYAVDHDWRLTYLNSKAEALLGRPRSELLGRVLWEAFPQAIGTKSHEMLLKAMAERAPRHFETHYAVTHSWIEVHVFPKTDGGLSVLYRDITERKAQEEALRVSEERFALAFRASPDPFAISRVDDGTILDINESFQDLFGYKREEVIGQSSLSLGMFVHREDREKALALMRQEGKLQHFETRVRGRAGEEHVVLLSSELLKLSGESALLTIMHDVTEQQQAQAALRESEGRVRRKLENILSPEGDLGVLELADLIDAPALQKLLEEFHAVAHLPIGVIDVKGNVLVGIGWQRICTDFHRVHPETCKYCVESDTELSAGVPKGEFRLYKCKNNLWDIATPIIVGGHHVGNLFSGQFFFEEEAVDRELFRAQARLYGFNENEYLAALDTVPRLNRDTVEHGMEFLQTLADTISQLGYSNVKLARLLVERDRLTKTLHDEQETFKTAQEIAHLGSWELDLRTNTLTWSDEVYRIVGLAPQEFAASYEAFLDHVHPDDRTMVDETYSSSLRDNRDGYDIEHRIVRRGSRDIRIVQESCRHVRDSSGAIVRSVGMVLDITERKQVEEERERLVSELRKTNERLEIILHDATDGFIIYDRAFRFAYIGDNSAERFRRTGRDPQVLRGKVLWEEFPEFVGSEALDRMREAMERRVRLTFESKYRERWYNTRCIPTADGGLAVLSLDVTEQKQAEEATLEVALFPEENPSPVLRINHQGSLVYANPGSRALMEELGCGLHEQVPASLATPVAEALQTGKPSTLEINVRDTVLSFLVVPVVRRDYANLYGRDVTKRRRAEESERQAHERYRALFEAIDEGFCIIDMLFDAGGRPIDYRFLEMNPSFEQQSGLINALGNRMRELAPAHEEHWYEIYGKVALTGQPVRFQNQAEALNRWYDVFAFPWGRPEDRQVAILFTDITARRQAEQHLHQVNLDLQKRNLELDAERLKWQKLIEGIADEVWACDLDGKVTVINVGTKPSAGLMDFERRPLEETLAEIDVLYLDGSVRPNDLSPLRRSLRGDILRGEEIVRNRRTGVTRIRQYSSAPVGDAEGRIIGAVAIVRDVTEEKQAEAQIRRLNEELEERVRQRTDALERANKELEAFSYSVSHDLKAPLRLIMGFADLLTRRAEENLSEKQQGFLQNIQQQASHMEELIVALLEFSRLSRKELRRVTVDTRKMVEEVVAEQRQILGAEAGARVVVEVADLPAVEADPILLRIVFTNLLSNAFKFTRTVKEPRVTVGAERQDGFYLFRVRDNGVGFPKGQTERLFKVFQRLHGAEQFEGSGVGLANVRKIVEKHGGQVCGDGEEGKGAAFFFALPTGAAGRDSVCLEGCRDFGQAS